MPREQIQFSSVDGTIATETTVRWTRQEQGGHVQISIQRYPQARVCVNGCDGVLTGCSSCPPSLLPEDAATKAVIGNSQVLSAMVGAGGGGGGAIKDWTAIDTKSDEEIDPTKIVPVGWAGSGPSPQEPTVVVGGPPRVSLGGAYVLPPIDDCELAQVQPDGSAIMWSDPLDRNSINKLIKVLRRARDQAYGQDE